MLSYGVVREELTAKSIINTPTPTWDDWLSFKRRSPAEAWVYLLRFSNDIFAWGTATGDGSRLRKMCLFHRKASGKYDRRVDYLMLKATFGFPEITVFAFNSADSARAAEHRLATLNGQAACFGGLLGSRKEITQQIHALYQRSPRALTLSEAHRARFDRFVSDILPQPRTMGGRSWHWGDVLEPGALERFGLAEYRTAIEAALDITISANEAYTEPQQLTQPTQSPVTMPARITNAAVASPKSSLKTDTHPELHLREHQLRRLANLLSGSSHSSLMTRNADFETNSPRYIFVIERPGRNLGKVFECLADVSDGVLRLKNAGRTGRVAGSPQYFTQYPGCYIVERGKNARTERDNWFAY